MREERKWIKPFTLILKFGDKVTNFIYFAVQIQAERGFKHWQLIRTRVILSTDYAFLLTDKVSALSIAFIQFITDVFSLGDTQFKALFSADAFVNNKPITHSIQISYLKRQVPRVFL